VELDIGVVQRVEPFAVSPLHGSERRQDDLGVGGHGRILDLAV
jgi:hypothetical protein